MILCDLPYGITDCKWDILIPFDLLWEQYNRVIKDNSAIVLFGSEPFATILRYSNLKYYKYDWVWDKVTGKGHLNAKIKPLQQTEYICVFGKHKINYYPIMERREKDRPDVSVEYSMSETAKSNRKNIREKIIRTHRYPKNILRYSSASNKNRLHPTQKPVDLLEYLIKTYTNEGEIEKDENYFQIAKKRLEEINQKLEQSNKENTEEQNQIEAFF